MAKIRVSVVPFKAGPVASFEDFAAHVARLVEEAAAEGPDLVVFPELFILEVANALDEPDLMRRLAGLADYTEDYLRLFHGLAGRHGLAIVAGSHLERVEDGFFNTSRLFLPDGTVRVQRKCHLTPIEASWMRVGEGPEVFEVGGVRLSILTCYDLEFPETCRLAVLRGAELLVSPSATLDEQGYWRVRHCGHARCVENQVFVAHCSLLGKAAGLPFWGMGSILTPCDAGFPLRGVAAESPPGEESVVTAELETDRLREIRHKGAVTPLRDRRRDMIEALCRLEGGSDRKGPGAAAE